jgi:hypothetical protein
MRPYLVPTIWFPKVKMRPYLVPRYLVPRSARSRFVESKGPDLSTPGAADCIGRKSDRAFRLEGAHGGLDHTMDNKYYAGMATN